MELKHLFTADEENRAVSPVIGVILMVAITVILAAVIGTFVLGLGDQVQQTSPNAQWNWDEQSTGQLNVTHEGGDSIAAARLEVTGANADAGGTNGSPTTAVCDESGPDNEGTSDPISAGDTCMVSASSATGSNEYRLIWTAEGGSQSSTLSSYETAA